MDKLYSLAFSTLLYGIAIAMKFTAWRHPAFRERLKRLFEVPIDPRRGTTGRVYEIYEPNVSLVHRVLAREQTRELILVRNSMTVDWSMKMIALLQADPGLRVEPLAETKGIRLFRIRQNGV